MKFTEYNLIKPVNIPRADKNPNWHDQGADKNSYHHDPSEHKDSYSQNHHANSHLLYVF